MKKIVKRGFFMVFIYVIAIVATLFTTNRIEELDSIESTTNHSLSIKLSR